MSAFDTKARAFGFSCFLLLYAASCSLSGRSAAASQPQDHFLGTWRLNQKKSAHTHYGEQQMLIVDRQGSRYKFTYVFPDGKGGEHRQWFITDMKGKRATIEGLNLGVPFSTYVTRKDSDSFDTFSELASVSEQYRVSPDGQTIKVRRQLFVDDEPPEHVFIFDRVH